jgi:hypothetical protein
VLNFQIRVNFVDFVDFGLEMVVSTCDSVVGSWCCKVRVSSVQHLSSWTCGFSEQEPIIGLEFLIETESPLANLLDVYLCLYVFLVLMWTIISLTGQNKWM